MAPPDWFVRSKESGSPSWRSRFVKEESPKLTSFEIPSGSGNSIWPCLTASRGVIDEFLDVRGTPPALGRSFTAGAGKRGECEVVLSDEEWHELPGGDASLRTAVDRTGGELLTSELASLLAQRRNRIDARRTPCGHETRGDGDRAEHQCRTRKRRRIRRSHPEQHALENARQRECSAKTQHDADAGQARSLPDRAPQHSRGRCAEGDANADLLRTPLDGVREPPINPDRRERQRQDREHGHGGRPKPRQGDGLAQRLFH